jgi:hypothetical protein
MAVQMIGSFFQPTSRHWRLYQQFRDILCSGYVGRNPTERISQVAIGQRSPARGVFTGMFALGKSLSVRQILSTFPRMIAHTSFRGVEFAAVQVVSVTVTCPVDGSVRTFCLEFLRAIDQLLNTNYLNSFGHRHSTATELIQTVEKVAQTHSLGLVVIDDVQNLNRVKKKICVAFADAMISFSLAAGVPIVFVGNTSILKNSGFSAPLSFQGVEHTHWTRFEDGSEDWSAFLENLWACNYTFEENSLTDDLRSTMYHCTQGIPGIATRLYGIAQKRVIESSGSERITSDLLQNIAKASFLPAEQQVLEAVRKNDIISVRDMWDLDEADFVESPGRKSKCKPPQKPKTHRAARAEILLSEFPRWSHV